MPAKFLNVVDSERADRVLRKLGQHDTVDWVLTGGFAIEIHHLRLGRPCLRRGLMDVDFAVDTFGEIPGSLADDFQFRHIHPFDPPGKTLLQAIDSQEAVRIDVFRAFGNTIGRSGRLRFPWGEFRLISLEDLTARAARLAFDLVGGRSVARKYARDFERLYALVSPAQVELAWQDQRKPGQPVTFQEASSLLRHHIRSCSRNSLIEPRYSTAVNDVCERCHQTANLSLADPQWVLSVLGYC